MNIVEQAARIIDPSAFEEYVQIPETGLDRAHRAYMKSKALHKASEVLKLACRMPDLGDHLVKAEIAGWVKLGDSGLRSGGTGITHCNRAEVRKRRIADMGMDVVEPKVFLGGTCGTNNWRDGFIERLTARGVDPKLLFNPVVKDWNPTAAALETRVKSIAEWCLFYIGSPVTNGDPNTISTYSIVEAIMNLYDRPDRTIVVFDNTGLSGTWPNR